MHIYSLEVFTALQSKDFCFISSCFKMSFLFKDSLLNLKAFLPYLFLLGSGALLLTNIKQLLVSTRVISLTAIKVSSHYCEAISFLTGLYQLIQYLEAILLFKVEKLFPDRCQKRQEKKDIENVL